MRGWASKREMCIAIRAGICLAVVVSLALVAPGRSSAAPLGMPGLSLELTNAQSPAEVSGALQILVLLTVLSLAPAILLMMTSFTRTVIVLSFVRSAIGTQQVPPNQVVIGLALFITLFTMMPVFGQISEQAWKPYMAGQISQEDALSAAALPLREFMLRQTRESDLELFVNLSGGEQPGSPDDLGLEVIIPAFMISELKTAFQMGFVVFIPFLVIDILVSSVLMSMGMMMLPPVLISLPFKILLFVLVDGWSLVVESLVRSFAA